LRDQLQSGSRSVPRPPEQKESAPEPTQLVFADKHTEQIQNYAIVRQTLWVFDGSRTRKIPLSNLDIPATEKANEDQGVDFTIPNERLPGDLEDDATESRNVDHRQLRPPLMRTTVLLRRS